MGLSSKGSIATLWSVEAGEKSTRGRISVSKKNKETGEYEQEFSGYVRFIGKGHHTVKSLAEKDKIRITEFEVTTRYDKEKNITYTNYTVWDCEKYEYSQAQPQDGNPF